MKKVLAAMSLLCSALLMHADDGQFMRVTTSAGDVAVAIEQVQEVTFGDVEMSVLKTDGSLVTFANDLSWSITFSPNGAGINDISIENANYPVRVYDINGMLMQELNGGDTLDYGTLPNGVFIVKSGDKQFKIYR